MILRLFLFLEAASFAVASFIHAGFIVPGYAHARARVPEAVISLALFAGLFASWFWPAQLPRAAFYAQGFALLGTVVGLFTIAVGVGPRTAPDLAYHAAILVVLLFGLVLARGALQAHAVAR